MRSYLLTGIVILLILGFAVVLKIKNGRTAVPPTSNEELTQVPEQTLPTEVTVTVSAADDLRQGGSSYLDPNGVYSFLYPNDFKFDTQNNGQVVRVYKQGPTQRGQTEMYDGAIVVFQSENLGAMNLSDWVDKKIKDSTADGSMMVTEAKKPLNIKKYIGFTYELRGLGESQYYVISKDPDSRNAVVITTLVADPEKVGFQKEVDSIFSTIELYK